MRHFTEDELASYEFDPSAFPDRQQLENHVADCAQCSSQLTFIRTIDSGLSDEVAWEIAEHSNVLTHSQLELREIAIRTAQETAEAEQLLSPLLKNPTKLAWLDISKRPGFCTGGVVRRLLRAARDEMEGNPLVALEFADNAVSVAEGLADHVYPAKAVYQLRGNAWKERANALRLLGDYDKALEALVHAGAAFEEVAVAPDGPPSIKYIRAIVLYERGLLDDALLLAEESAHEFSLLEDDDKYLRSRHLAANIHFYKQDVRGARSIYEQILSYGKRLNDLKWIARESRTLAHCALELGETDRAAEHFHEALAAFTELGLEAEVTRTRWGIACLALSSGRAADALPNLESVQHDFQRLKMLTDDALTTFDIMDALLLLDRVGEIPALAEALVRRFVGAGMLTSALAAFAYVKESGEAGALTKGAIEHVRQFVRRLEREPELLFMLPPKD